MAADDPRRHLARECLIASLGILALLKALKHSGGFIGRHAFTIAAAAQLYVPILLIGRYGITRDEIGLCILDAKKELALFAWISLLTIVPYAIGHHYWQTLLFGRSLSPALPADLWSALPTQVLVVALPEELYFRGYLQRRLEKLWPAKRRLFGTPFGAAILLASTVFAFAHFLGEYRIDRLGPFFPALLFGLLRTKTGGLLVPVLYHAFCNLLSDVLWSSYA